MGAAERTPALDPPQLRARLELQRGSAGFLPPRLYKALREEFCRLPGLSGVLQAQATSSRATPVSRESQVLGDCDGPREVGDTCRGQGLPP